MKYIPAFVFGDTNYYMELIPSGIFRRDTFESISRDPAAKHVKQRQEQMMMDPPMSEIEEHQQMAKDELDKVVERVNNIYLRKKSI